MKLDIWMVLSPDDDSVEEGEYVRLGVDGTGLEYCWLEYVQLGVEGEAAWLNSGEPIN